MKATSILLILIASISITACSAEDGAQGPEGPQGEQGPQGEPGPEGTIPKPNFTISGALNISAVNANLLSSIGPEIMFDKEYDDSILEVIMNSNCYSGVFDAGALAVQFEVRIDNQEGTYGNKAVIRTTDTNDFLSILEVFDELPAGPHSVQVFVRTINGTSNGISLDPGGFGGRVIIKESF